MIAYKKPKNTLAPQAVGSSGPRIQIKLQHTTQQKARINRETKQEHKDTKRTESRRESWKNRHGLKAVGSVSPWRWGKPDRWQNRERGKNKTLEQRWMAQTVPFSELCMFQHVNLMEGGWLNLQHAHVCSTMTHTCQLGPVFAMTLFNHTTSTITRKTRYF